MRVLAARIFRGPLTDSNSSGLAAMGPVPAFRNIRGPLSPVLHEELGRRIQPRERAMARGMPQTPTRQKRPDFRPGTRGDHGMEEVVSSSLTRSTKTSSHTSGTYRAAI
jgi:hypothetical protein